MLKSLHMLYKTQLAGPAVWRPWLTVVLVV